MKHSKRDLERLAQVTEAARTAAQARLRVKVSAEAKIQREIDHLAEERALVLQTLSLSDTRGAAQVVCHGDWLKYADRRRAQLNVALARARALALTERQAAQKAHGRQQVAAELLRRAERERKKH